MRRRAFQLFSMIAASLFFTASAFAVSSYLGDFNAKYGTAGTALDTCGICHVNPAGGGSRNSYGIAFQNVSTHSSNPAGAFTTIESQDSDGDGFTNIAEITARTFPGDANSHPSTADTTSPTVTVFVIPATSSSLTVSVSAFAATDNVGVTGYLITESSTTPSAAAAGWSTTPPGSYTFTTAGAKTLYAWARDAAGNISSGRSATVTVTLPTTGDTTPPTVPTGLTASAASNSVILSWNASVDNVGVTAYLIFRNGAQIAATTDTSFVDTAVTVSNTYSYTVSARDAAGNVSAGTNVVSVTIPSSNVMPLPTAQQAFPRIFSASPVFSTDPAQAVPIGLGALAEGGNTGNLQIGLLPFSGPVDIYVVLTAQTIDQNEVYLLRPDNELQPLSLGLVAWKSGVTGSVNESATGDVPLSSITQGLFTIQLYVTPAGSQSVFYLWETSFSAGTAIRTSLEGSQEVPPVSTTGTGTAYLGVDLVTGQIDGTVTFSGLTSAATAAAIYIGAAGSNGGIIIPMVGGEGATSGQWFIPEGLVLTADQVNALKADGLYINVQTQAFPDGEIRGQIIYPVVTIITSLDGSQAVPPVATSGTGTATIVANVDTGEVSGTLTFSGLSSNATAGHIHEGAPGTVGPAVIELVGGSGATSGTYSVPFGTILTQDEIDELAVNGAYIMVHTVNHPDGEIRGQLVPPTP